MSEERARLVVRDAAEISGVERAACEALWRRTWPWDEVARSGVLQRR